MSVVYFRTGGRKVEFYIYCSICKSAASMGDGANLRRILSTKFCVLDGRVLHDGIRAHGIIGGP